MPGLDRHHGRLFDEVAEIYHRVRPGYPDEVFADLAAIAGIGASSSVFEVGCGTGQATGSLASLGCSVTAVEPGPGMAALASRNLAGLTNVEVEVSRFEDQEDRGRRFDALVAASAWLWSTLRSAGRRAHAVRREGAAALLADVVVRVNRRSTQPRPTSTTTLPWELQLGAPAA
jgi:protein-L-isoaspartate O-methyltransferase